MENPFTILQEKATRAFQHASFPDTTYGIDIRAPFDESIFTLEKNNAHSLEQSSFKHETLEKIILCDAQTAVSLFPEKMSRAGTLLSLENKLEAFHLAQGPETIIIHIPDNTQSKQPILILPFKNPFSHVCVFAGKNSTVFLDHAEKNSGVGTFSLYSSVVEIFADENAHVSYSSLQEQEAPVRMAVRRAHVSKNASVDWNWAEMGSSFVRMDVHSLLSGAGASTQNNGLFAPIREHVLDLHARATHTAPHTISNLRATGSLDDSAKVVYHGLIKMTKEASRANGKQKADMLLLSPSAEADPVPILEIEGADMNCSHASTVGRIDREKLFYLISRGLDDETARALYLKGFFEHALHFFPFCSTLHAPIEKAILARLSLNEKHPSFFSKEVTA